MKGDEYYTIAKFYDGIVGKVNDTAEYIKVNIKRYNPGTKTLLELGCGTGLNLSSFHNNFDVTGIDISGKMLSIARKKN